MAKKKTSPSIIELLANVESDGNYSPVQGPTNPSMAGKYQFDWNQFKDKIMKSTGVKTRQEFIDNPKAQEKWMQEYLPLITKEAKANLATIQKYEPKATLQDAILLGHHTGFGAKFQKAIAAGISPMDIKDGAGVSNRDYLAKAYNTPAGPPVNPQQAVIYGNNLTPSNTSLYATENGVAIPVTSPPVFGLPTDPFKNPIKKQSFSSINETNPPMMADNQLSANYVTPENLVEGGIKVPTKSSLKETPKVPPPVTTEEQPTQSWIAKGLNSLAPYASNMAAAFQKPAPVPVPMMDRPLSLQRVSMANDRNEVERGVRGNNLNFDQTLDAQTAAANKQFTLAQRFNQLSKVNQDERNQNIDISNREAEANNRIQMSNMAKLDQYGRDQADRRNVIGTNNVANISNASDKFMTQQRDQKMYDLDKEKANYQNMMYSKYLDDLKKANKTNATVQRFGGKLPYSAGKFIKVFN
jgi:hypothetical protein